MTPPSLKIFLTPTIADLLMPLLFRDLILDWLAFFNRFYFAWWWRNEKAFLFVAISHMLPCSSSARQHETEKINARLNSKLSEKKTPTPPPARLLLCRWGQTWAGGNTQQRLGSFQRPTESDWERKRGSFVVRSTPRRSRSPSVARVAPSIDLAQSGS